MGWRFCSLKNVSHLQREGFNCVDTRNEEAKAFWLKQGFVPFRKTQRSLFLPVQTILRELKI